MPNIGLVKIKDSESKQFTWIDTSDKATRDKYKHENYKYENEIINQLKNSGVDTINISTNEDYIKPLMNSLKEEKVKIFY